MSHDGLKFRQLEVFRAVMTEGSATAAARRLNMSQPAVSQHIGQLEADLDIALFLREKGRLIPTEQALALHEEVSYAFDGLERIFNVASDLKSDRRTTFRIAVSHSLCEHLIPALMARFALSYPQLRFNVQLGTYEQIVALVARREVDLGVAKQPIEHPGISTLPLMAVQSVCVLPRGHALAAKSSLGAAELAEQPLVLLGRDKVSRHGIEAIFRTRNIVPNVRVETQSVGAACAFVAAGLGVAIVNELMAVQYLRRNLVLRPLLPTVTHRFVVIWPDSMKRSALTLGFAEQLRDLVEAEILAARAHGTARTAAKAS